VQSGIVAGMGALGWARLTYGVKLGAIELAVRAGVTRRRFAAVDTTVDTFIAAGGLGVAYERPWRRVDLRVSLLGEAQYWHQAVARASPRDAAVLGVGVGAGVRVPITGRLFLDGALEGFLYFPDVGEPRGVVAAPTLGLELGGGVVF
jgi:hypothetical protein